MAWIYHNAELWVISMSSDWTNWLTIADKNLGATQVYNNGDTLSEVNSGKYYQWWNNHWFSFTGSVTTSSTRVNASIYWAKLGYYESSTFIKWAYYWDTSNNTNLWWWVTGSNEDKRWPCPEWFHIPTMAEADSLLSTMTSIGFPSWSDFNYYLKMPYAGVYVWDNASYAGSNYAHYTTSTSVDNDSRYMPS